MGLEEYEGKLKTASMWSPFVTLFIPWIYYSYPSGYTVVFSVGFTNSFRDFVDIWNWTFNYTQGAFTSAYWYWHVTLGLILASAVFSVTEYKRLSSLFLILAGFTLIRFVFGFVTHVSFIFPIGTVWMFAWGALIYWFDVTEGPRD